MASASLKFLLIFVLASLAQAGDFALGLLPVAKEQLVELSYTNTSGKLLHLAEPKSSCGCFRALQIPSEVSPGETVRIFASYQASAPGPIKVEVFLMEEGHTEVLQTILLQGYATGTDSLLTPTAFRAAVAAGATIVDLRSPEKFARVHLARSLNVQAFALRSRVDLRSRPLVLLDEGLNAAELETLLGTLRAAGFSRVQGLSGGLVGWMREGGAVQGREPTLAAAAMVSPAEWAGSRRSFPWQVLSLATAWQVEGADRALVVQDWSRLPSALVPLTKLPHLLNENRLVLVPDLATALRVEALLAKAQVNAHVFYLLGGAATLSSYRAEQSTVLANSNERLQGRPSNGQPMRAANSGCLPCGRK